MELVNELKALIPDYAKDVRLNLEATLLRSALAPADAAGAALAAAYAAKSPRLVATLRGGNMLDATDTAAALSAAALMGMNNVWYPYVAMSGDADLKALPAQLRMQAYATHGGVDKRRFELFALAASIVGKCEHCVRSHFALLKQDGVSVEQLRDVGRIAAAIAAAANALSIEEPVAA